MLEFDPAALGAKDTYFLLTALVVPRPIAWVSTVDAQGRTNLAPYSYFNACSGNPPIVHFTSTSPKHSLANARATGEFVVNVVSDELQEPMRISSAEWPQGVSEFEMAGLEAAPSAVVRPPRVARAKAAMECRVRQILTMGEGTMVFGDVVRFHVSPSVRVRERVDMARLRPVGRLAALDYATIGEVTRLTLPDWVQARVSDYQAAWGLGAWQDAPPPAPAPRG